MSPMTKEAQRVRKVWFAMKYLTYDVLDGGNHVERYVHLPNDIFQMINATSLHGSHKAFAFSAYTYLKATSERSTIELQTNPSIKELWGYSRANKTLDGILKRDGLLDNLGLTTTRYFGQPEDIRDYTEGKGTKAQHKVILYGANLKEKYFKVPLMGMVGSMCRPDKLGAVGFYVYAYIWFQFLVRARGKGSLWADLSDNYLAYGLGLSENTVKKYTKALNYFALIKKTYMLVNGKREVRYDDYGDYDGKPPNRYMPSTKVFDPYRGLKVMTEQKEAA